MPPFSDKLPRLLVKIPDPGHDADFRVIMSRFFQAKRHFGKKSASFGRNRSSGCETGQFGEKTDILVRNPRLIVGRSAHGPGKHVSVVRQNVSFSRQYTYLVYGTNCLIYGGNCLGCETKCLVGRTKGLAGGTNCFPVGTKCHVGGTTMLARNQSDSGEIRHLGPKPGSLFWRENGNFRWKSMFRNIPPPCH